MKLHDDLLEQAKHLVAREQRRPRQASLRRAISAAYYALFHLLAAEASHLVLRGTGLEDLRPKVARAFIHKEMKTVARAFRMRSQDPKLPDEIGAIVKPLGSPPADLMRVAGAFVDLQEGRHQADYDLSRRFKRSEAEILVNQAEEAFSAWRRIRRTPPARAFLISLLVWNRWDRE